MTHESIKSKKPKWKWDCEILTPFPSQKNQHNPLLLNIIDFGMTKNKMKNHEENWIPEMESNINYHT